MTAHDEAVGYRPCLILAHTDAAYTAAAARAFRRRGWDVYAAETGPEVRRLTRMMQPQLVVLEAELPEESGWLTCDKLTGEFGQVPVILVGGEPTPMQHAFAAFVGAAALVGRGEGATALLPQAPEPALPAAG
jgi:DNA-binding response OmpR family regulator